MEKQSAGQISPALLLTESHTSHSTAAIWTSSVVFLRVNHNDNNTNGFVFSLLKPQHQKGQDGTLFPKAKSVSKKHLDCPPLSFPFSNVLNAKCTFLIISFTPHPSITLCVVFYFILQSCCSALTIFKLINIIFMT